MTLTVTPTDLANFLGDDTAIDSPRSPLLIGLAMDLCQTVVSPLPDGAKGIVLSVAAQAYANPQGIASESQTVGPYSQAIQRPGQTGLYLTKDQRRNLRLFDGRGGAFSYDPTPADAGLGLPIWDENTWTGLIIDENLDGYDASLVGDGPAFPAEFTPIGPDFNNPVTVTADFIATPGQVINADATAGPIVGTVSLNPVGVLVEIHKTDSTGHTITLIGQNGAAIGNGTPIVLNAQGDLVQLASNGYVLAVF